MLLRFAVAAAAALTVLPCSAGAQVLATHDVSVEMGLAIAETALSQCGSHVSVAVVDHAGRLRVFLQGNNAAPHNIELARRKAYTANTFGRPTGDWMKRTGPDSAIAGQRQLSEVIPLQGGVPIKIGEETIGGVGLSGAPKGGEQEEACGLAGVAKVADQLK